MYCLFYFHKLSIESGEFSDYYATLERQRCVKIYFKWKEMTIYVNAEAALASYIGLVYIGIPPKWDANIPSYLCN